MMQALHAGLLMAVLVLDSLTEVSSQCSDGDVRLVNGSASNEGVVMICLRSNWGTVCGDGYWTRNDATVVCRQLGYPNGYATDYRVEGQGNTLISEVICYNPSNEASLLECDVNDKNHDNFCNRRLAGVVCQDDRRVKNVSAELTIDISSTCNVHTVSVTWVENTSAVVPRSFQVKCQNDFNTIQVLVSNQTTTAQVTGLLPSSSYNCCVAGVYRVYVARAFCTRNFETPGSVVTTESPVTQMIINSDSSSVKVVGGVLGFIIILLLILLIISAVALVCLLRPRLKDSAIYGRLSRLVDKKSSNIPVRNNASYTTQQPPPAAAHVSTVSRTSPQVTGSTAQSVGDTVPSYSSVGPAYEALDSNRRQLEEGANRVNMRERYELSETLVHAETDALSGAQEPQSYEVPVPSNMSGSVGDEIQH